MPSTTRSGALWRRLGVGSTTPLDAIPELTTGIVRRPIRGIVFPTFSQPGCVRFHVRVLTWLAVDRTRDPDPKGN